MLVYQRVWKCTFRRLAFRCGSALIKLQSFGGAGAVPSLSHRGPCFSSSIFSLNHFFWSSFRQIRGFFSRNSERLQLLQPTLQCSQTCACPQQRRILADVGPSHICDLCLSLPWWRWVGPAGVRTELHISSRSRWSCCIQYQPFFQPFDLLTFAQPQHPKISASTLTTRSAQTYS